MLLPLLLSVALAQEPCGSVETFDPLRVYLVTTSPGEPLFSAFGHSALWLSGGGLARPVVVDWGNFNSAQSDPVADFLDGTMRYTLEALTPEELVARAARRDRTVVAQRLDLPPTEAEALRRAVLQALGAEDRSFRYDWLRDNCSTRIRDVLDLATGGAVSAQAVAGGGHSARHEILRHLGAPQRGLGGAGLWLGWHVMATELADRPLAESETLFLPDRLMQGLRAVQRPWPDGQLRPLVGQECTLHEGSWTFVPGGPPRWWPTLLGVGLAWAGLVLGGLRWRAAGWRAAGAAGLGLLGLLAGGIGCLTAWLALTSSIEALRLNQSWWLLSPLSLLLLPGAVAVLRGQVQRWHVAAAAGLAVAAVVGSLASAVGLVGQVLWPTPALVLPPLLAAVALLLARAGRDG